MNADSTINIFQKNWAFTTADSEKTQIKTGSFGPCYVVSFTNSKFAALSHIDDSTKVNSIQDIFSKFQEHSVALKDVKVIILGGWKEHPESFKWGQKIIKKIAKAGFEDVSTKNMYKKNALNLFQQMTGISQSEASNHYHLGALVDAKTGKTFLLKEFETDLEREQKKQTEEFVKQHGYTDKEFPITQVV